MLKIRCTTGSIELTPDQERRVRALDDASVCRALNAGVDVYVCAVLRERPQIGFTPERGWHVKALRPSLAVAALSHVRLH